MLTSQNDQPLFCLPVSTFGVLPRKDPPHAQPAFRFEIQFFFLREAADCISSSVDFPSDISFTTTPMHLDRRTYQIAEDHQRQFEIFLVHLKSLLKIPRDVSLCHLQRAPEPLAFLFLGCCQAHCPNPLCRKSQRYRRNDGPFSNNSLSHSCRICIFQ